MSKHKKWICFDFDGVCSEYHGWKGFDVLGVPIPEVVDAIRKLKAMGYAITIFTTRLDTPKLRKWLNDYSVPYDSINSNAHNPPNTSQKPIYHCIVDDRAVRYVNQTADTLIEQIETVVNYAEDCKDVKPEFRKE